MQTKKRLQGRIASVSIRGFRTLVNIENLQIPRLAVLIGENGSGKSNFIRFFEMISWMLRSQHLQDFVHRQGGGDDQLFMGARTTPRLDAQIRIETNLGFNDYRFALAHVSGDTLLLVDEAFRYSDKSRDTESSWIELPMPSKEAVIVERQQDKTAGIVVDLLKNCSTYQFHDTSANAYIKQAWDINDNVFLRSDGGNLAPILLRLRENDIMRYKLIVKQITRTLPAFEDFVLQPAFEKVALRWIGKNGDKTFGAHLTSDGSLRMFCLFTLLNLPAEMLPDVLFFDEPELGLHPHAINLVAEMLKRLSQSKQIFVATQSPFMVDCFELENVIAAEMKGGATDLKSLSRERYQQWLDDEYQLSDLWLKDAIGGVTGR